MAITMGTLYLLAALGTLSSVGIFVGFSDEETRLVVGFLSSLIWALFGISSFNVVVFSSFAASRSEAIMPLVVLGIGMSVLLLLFTVYQLFVILRRAGPDVKDPTLG